MKNRLASALRSTRSESGAADPAEQLVGRAEQTVEPVDQPERDQILALAPALVAPQDPQLGERRRVGAARELLREHLDERRAVEESEVDALTSERMDGMRGIADERETLLAVLTRMGEPQREMHALRRDLDLAERTVDRTLDLARCLFR